MPLDLLFKIAVPPVLVALMSLAARRWGATVGGLIMGLPWMTGPVLFFLATGKGDAFAIRACLGIELAVLGISAFILAYGAASGSFRWPVCTCLALSAYLAVAWLTQSIDLELWVAAACSAVTLSATYFLIPKPRTTAAPGALPWWDIPARMMCVFTLVAGIMTGADLLGPQRSGILASYPVILTVIGAFTHHQWGRDAALRVLRGITLSLLGFVVFFVIVGYALPVIGLVAAFVCAAIAAVAVSAALLVFNRWQMLRDRRV
jgi:hypothetical protein